MGVTRGRSTLFVNDSIGGGLYEVAGSLRTVAKLSAPARFLVADLDRDGRHDVVATDLGSFIDQHVQQGQLIWLRGQEDGVLRPDVLLRDVGRVADVEAIDFDRDGDLDLAVAVFGIAAGQVAWLEQRTDGSAHAFELRTLDSRKGAVDVTFADLDGDGAPELLAVLAQEHEVVMAYRRLPDGSIRAHELGRGAEPTWGSSGISVETSMAMATSM